MKSICVYCGSSMGENPAYREIARQIGELLATSGIGLVYGGGNVGLMGVLADAALAAGGDVIGIIPGDLVRREEHDRDPPRLLQCPEEREEPEHHEDRAVRQPNRHRVAHHPIPSAQQSRPV